MGKHSLINMSSTSWWADSTRVLSNQAKRKKQKDNKQMKIMLTAVNVAKCPGIIMQISDNKFLSWRLHWVILN